MSTQSTDQASYPRAEVAPPSGKLFPHKHLLGIWGLDPTAIKHLLDVADGYVDLNRQAIKSTETCRGLTQINLFFEKVDKWLTFARAGHIFRTYL